MPEFTGVTYTYGYRHPENHPEYAPGSPFGWRVREPNGLGGTVASGDMFWSERFGQPFEVLDHVGNGVWNATFPDDWEPLPDPNIVQFNTSDYSWTSIAENDSNTVDWFPMSVESEISVFTEPESDLDSEILEIEPEYTEWVPGRPFLHRQRWYVVMAATENAQEWHYEERQVWFCEYENCEFRLLRRVRSSLFGSIHSFRIEWLDGEDIHTDMDDGYSVENEDTSAVAVAPQVATNIGREVPLVSFESEFSGNGDMVARRLYDAGFGMNRHPDAYHNSSGRFDRTQGSDTFCYVETDSSCGYELIFDRLQLRNRNQAERISQVFTILKELKEEGNISLSARCGFHVHVDVSTWGMKEIVSAYHLWNYLEDPIFRFASAFWNSHRDEEVGGGYSTPVPKGHVSRRDIGRVLDGRRDALNFSPILRARQNCGCSAIIYEDWANCTCAVSQPTLEFRVFNATLNQRKIKAYLAFCIAFVNKVKEVEFDPVNFPEMRWVSTPRKEGVIAGDEYKSWDEATIERVKFIMNEFPLTGAEKGDINYCLRNSSLSSVMEWV